MSGTARNGAVVGPRAATVLHFIGVDVNRVHSVSEKVHYIAIAAAVFVGPLTTSAIVVYAAHFVYHASIQATALLAAMTFVVYFFLEFGIASQPTPKHVLERLKVGGVRLLLVIIVSFLAGEVVTEQYFKTEVAAEVTTERASQFERVSTNVAKKADENRRIAELGTERGTYLAEISRREGELGGAQGRVNDIQKLIDDENQGRLGGRTVGCGPFCEAKQAELVVAVGDRDRISADVAGAKATLEAEIRRVDSELGALRTRVNDKVDVAVAAANSRDPSPAERFSALNRVTFGDAATLLIRLAITLGLMLIEASAVLLKLGRQTRHDAEVIAEETVGRTEFESEARQKIHAIRLQENGNIHDGRLKDWKDKPTRKAQKKAGPQLAEIRTTELLDRAKAEADTARLQAQAEYLLEKVATLRRIHKFKDELEDEIDLDDEPADDEVRSASDVHNER